MGKTNIHKKFEAKFCNFYSKSSTLNCFYNNALQPALQIFFNTFEIENQLNLD